MASSSSSHQQNDEHHAFSGIEPPGKRRKVDETSRLYDVFINHRGPDVKQTLATQLYNSLQELGILAFLDSEEMILGKSFPSTIETAIPSAAVHIAIFSKGYAESPWCLAELALMIQSKAKMIPVFYDVQPWELRYIEKGVYAEAFTHYEKKGRHLEKLKQWKEALQSVSFITAEDFNGDCKNIVSAVEKEVQRLKSKLYVAKYPVGLHKLVQDFEKQCLDELVDVFESQCGMREEGKDKSKIVGIFGMGGMGKTTLSKELFNRKRSQFNEACFLFDVREASAKRELPSLQTNLLNDIFNKKSPDFKTIEEGMSCLEDCIERSSYLSFLVVLDDIDHVEQLDALLIIDMLNKSVNSLVIVTTRDVGVLVSTGITIGYNLKGMDRDAARELFCWHAFQKPHPTSGYEDLVNAFIDGCGGLPLSLQVLGRHVHGRGQKYWRLELNKVSRMLPQDIQQRLKISFDALDNEEKQIFIDIACFFIDEEKSMALRIWERSGWNAHHALQTLKDKCLVEEVSNWNNRIELRMHDHLRDLGREMVNGMGHPHRMWHPQDTEFLELEGFQAILSKSNWRCSRPIRDKSMGAKITYFIGNSDDWGHTSTSLLWLNLDFNYFVFGYKNGHISSIPSWIPLQNLQYLRIKGGHLKRLWQSDAQEPSSLKELEIEDTILEEFPDLSGVSNHLRVELDGKEIPIEWVSFLDSLTTKPSSLLRTLDHDTTFESSSSSLCLSRFIFREIVALNNRGKSPTVKPPMSSLRKVKFRSQELVTKVLISGCHYSNLESLELWHMKNLTDVDLKLVTSLNSVYIADCEKLNCLKLDDCANLKTVELVKLPKLVIFSIHHCPELNSIDLSDCEKLKSLSGIRTEWLEISRCPKVKLLPTMVTHLKVQGQNEWETVPGISDLTSLETVIIIECEELEEVSVARLSFLERLRIERCDKLEKIAGIEELPALKDMQIVQCNNAALRNSIQRLQRVPSEQMIVIGIAAEGAETMLGPHLFSEWISAEGEEMMKLERMADGSSMRGGAIMYCAVVAFHSYFSSDCAKVVLVGLRSLSSSAWPEIREPMFTTDHEKINYRIAEFQNLLHITLGNSFWSHWRADDTTIEKAYTVMVNEVEEWGTMKLVLDQLLKERCTK